MIIKVLKEIYNEKKYKHVVAYFPMENEVDIRDFLNFVIEKNGFVVLPKVINKENMKFFCVSDLNSELKKGYANLIFEPIDGLAEFLFQDDVLMIIPGVIFDEKCNRKGHGCGFYDRFLSNKENVFKVGVCSQSQIVKKLQQKSTDVPMDKVVTESEIYVREF